MKQLLQNIFLDPFDPSELIEGIRQLYKTREGWLSPFPWCEEFHFHLNDIFTRLKMISKKKTRGTPTDEVVNMSAIFKPHEECPQPRTVLIEGKLGVGKTTYCKKLAYDWATGKQEAFFAKFEVMLLLKCCDIKSNVWEAIDDQLLPRDIQEGVREKFFNFIRHNQSSVLVVLDGLDELPASKLPVFSELIQGRVLPKCHLVVTARHEAGIRVRKYCDTLLEINGFTEEDAELFICKYFKIRRDLAKTLLFKLKKDKSLKLMTSSPLNTALLCLLCEEFQGMFPESTTQLYLKITECVLRRYRKRNGLSETSEKLLEVYKTQLQHLGWIALNGLRNNNSDFEERELGNHAKELSGFGFLSVHPGGSKVNPSRRYAFLHKSFQEFFAGFYLSWQLLNGEITPDSLVSDAKFFHELQQVLLFSCGIVAAQCEETAVALITNITTQVNKDHNNSGRVALEGINECKREKSDFHVKLARVFGSCLTRQHISEDMSSFTTGAAAAASLAEALKANTTLTQLGFKQNNMGDAGAASLADAIKVNTTLNALVLWGNNIGDAGATSLSEAIKVTKTLTWLDLSYNTTGLAGVTSLAKAIKVNTTLTHLDLGQNNIGDAGATSLAEAMKFNKKLTHLGLQQNNIGCAGAASLAEVIKDNKTLTHLELQQNNIGGAGAASLAEAIKDNKTLTHLELQQNNIGDAGATSLAEALKVNTTLTDLDLAANTIGPASATSLAEAIEVNTTMTHLHLWRNNIGDAGAAYLAKAFKVNTTLTKLDLERSDIGDAGAISLAEAIKVNTALTHVDLQKNDIGGAGATSLAEAIKVNKTLTHLNLQQNHIGDAGVTLLADSIKVNNTLTELNLVSNKIGYAGANSLGEAMKLNTTLSQLYIWSNNIGDAGATFLAEAIKLNTALTYLDVQQNNIGDVGCTSLAEGVKVNKTLNTLILQHNRIGDAGAASLAEAIKVNTTLILLDLEKNNISDAGASSLAEAIKFNKTLSHLELQ